MSGSGMEAKPDWGDGEREGESGPRTRAWPAPSSPGKLPPPQRLPASPSRSQWRSNVARVCAPEPTSPSSARPRARWAGQGVGTGEGPSPGVSEPHAHLSGLPHLQSPAYTLVWTRLHNGKLPSRAMDFNGILTIRNVQPSDAGTYVCTGSNMFAMDQGTATLHVQGTPFTSTPDPPGPAPSSTLSRTGERLSSQLTASELEVRQALDSEEMGLGG